LKKLYTVGLVIVASIVAGVALSLYLKLQGSSTPGSGMPRIDGARVLAILGSGYDHGEYTGVADILIGQGATVTAAGFTTETLQGHGGNTTPDIAFSAVNISAYDAIFIPGGDGPRSILDDPRNQTVLSMVVQANNEGKILAAICHGPWVLAGARVVNGKNVTGNQDTHSDLRAAGGNLITGQRVVRDGNIITGVGPPDIQAFSEEVVNALAEALAPPEPHEPEPPEP